MRQLLLVLACLLLIALAAPGARARRLVEPGDALVGTGDAVFVVRAGGGVAPFTPRNGSGTNRLVAGGGVVVDAASGRVFATSNPVAGARVVMIDPESGAQTNLTSNGIVPLDLDQTASGIDVLLIGGLFVTTWGEAPPPTPVTTAAVSYLGPPTASGVTAVSTIGDLDGEAAELYGLSVTDQTEAGAGPKILVAPIGPGEALRSVSWTTGASTPVTGTPVQALATIHDVDYRCVVGPILTTCTRDWVEARIDGNGDCVASDAAVYSYKPLSELTTVFVGPPLRCPVAIERAPDGSLLVVDGAAGPTSATAFVKLRLYRFRLDGGVWTPTLLAGESELPDSGPQPPALAVSPVSLPEPDAAGAALATLLGVAWAVRRPRSIGSGVETSPLVPAPSSFSFRALTTTRVSSEPSVAL